MDNATIGKALNCHPTTVGRMIATEHRKLSREYEAGGRFYPAEVVGVMIDRWERYRRLAMQTYQTTNDDRARMRALLVALRADQQAVTLLQDISLLPRDFGILRLEAGRTRFAAGEIRRLADELRKSGTFTTEHDPDDLIPRGERAFLDGDVIEDGHE